MMGGMGRMAMDDSDDEDNIPAFFHPMFHALNMLQRGGAHGALHAMFHALHHHNPFDSDDDENSGSGGFHFVTSSRSPPPRRR